MVWVPLNAQRGVVCSELHPFDPDQLDWSCSSWCSNSPPTLATADFRQLPPMDMGTVVGGLLA